MMNNTTNNAAQTPVDTNATTRTSMSGSGTTAPPFFTLAIEGPNTVVALDASGMEIVSLNFDDFNELTSDEFREYAAAAVAAVTGTGTTDDSSLSNRPENDVISLLDSDNDDDMYIEEDIDEIFAAVLAENEHHAAALSAAAVAQREVERLDADLALALKLQEEEEQEKEKEEQQKSSRNPWRTTTTQNNHNLFSVPPTPALPSTTFSTIMGSAPGIPTSLTTSQRNTTANSTKYTGAPSTVEFPSLAPPPPPPPPSSTTSATKTFSFTTTQQKTRTAPLLSSVPPKPSSNSPGGIHSTAITSTTDFLDSYDDEAIEARATALRYTQAAAAKEEQKEQQHAGGGGGGASRQTFKKMMDSSNSNNNLKNLKEKDDDEEEGAQYSKRKKIRNLVLSMIAAGWEFMPDRRGSGHYIYQRFLPPTGQQQEQRRQILSLPCTPSSQRSIDAVHSRLQRMDREAAEVRAAATKTIENNGGKSG